MDSLRLIVVGASLALGCGSQLALAVDNPFTETFSSNASNWRYGDGVTGLDWHASGGPADSAYSSSTISFATLNPGDQPQVIRGAGNFGSSGSSGGAFFGNWLTAGITELSFDFRHNIPEATSFFVRLAPPSPNPGLVYVIPVTVAPNEWTHITVPIVNGTPYIYEGTTFNGVFGNIGRVQIGLIGGNSGPGTYTFGVDNIRVIPTPGAAAFLGMAGLFGLGRRRR